MADGAEGNLKLHDDGVCLAEQGRGGIHIFRCKRVVCALHDDDAILATGIHKDRGDAAGNAGGDAHVSRVNALRFKIPNRCGPEKIAPYFCHHAHVRAAETRRNRLVGAFAAEAEIELPAEDGFPRPREHIMERGKVHVSAAHNCNKGRLGHHFASGDSRRGLYKNPAREPHLLSIAKRTVSAVGLEWGCC